MGGLIDITYWHWLILGVLLIALEIFAPGAFFLWVGLAALVVGGISALFSLSLAFTLLAFAVLSIIFTIVGRRYFKVPHGEKKESLLNRRGYQYVGQQITLTQAIVNKQGRAVIGDTIWRVTGPDLPKGTVVEVVGVEGNSLVVKKVSLPSS